MKKGILLILSLFFLLLWLPACRIGSSPLAETVIIPVTATRDFGNIPIFRREAAIDTRMTAQDVLARVAGVRTDGSYITEMEGLRGDDRVYWMYYVNGMLSRYFASGYLIRPGDVMHWDFHPWVGANHGSSAIIGSYPEPLLHGYGGETRPALVVHSPGFSAEAGQIAVQLKKLGVAALKVKEESAVTEREKGDNNIILIASAESSLVRGLDEKHQPLGMYSHFDGSKLLATDYTFSVKQEYGPGSGVLQACQNPWNSLGTGSCQSVVFIVSGTDASGVKKAAQVLMESGEDILAKRTGDIEGTFGIIVTDDGKLVKTPL